MKGLQGLNLVRKVLARNFTAGRPNHSLSGGIPGQNIPVPLLRHRHVVTACIFVPCIVLYWAPMLIIAHLMFKRHGGYTITTRE